MWESRGRGIGTWDWSLGKAATLWRLPLESQPGTQVVCGVSGWSSEDVSERHSVVPGQHWIRALGFSLLNSRGSGPIATGHIPWVLTISWELQVTAWWLGLHRAEGCVRSGLPTNAGHPRALTGAGEAGMAGPTAQDIGVPGRGCHHLGPCHHEGTW